MSAANAEVRNLIIVKHGKESGTVVYFVVSRRTFPRWKWWLFIIILRICLPNARYYYSSAQRCIIIARMHMTDYWVAQEPQRSSRIILYMSYCWAC